MGILSFFTSKQANLEVREAFRNKLMDLEASLTLLTKKLDLMQTDIADLRGRVNKKLSFVVAEEKKQSEEQKKEDLNSLVPRYM